MGEFDSINATARLHEITERSTLRTTPAGEERQAPHHRDDEKDRPHEDHPDTVELHTLEEEIVVEAAGPGPVNGLDIAA